ncbi:hypothetical protein H5T55_06875 [Candidatus Bipolaricaulota bacterium]|nr:hypothetical protein [Candidatus Bipolaricaulota bacterium]
MEGGLVADFGPGVLGLCVKVAIPDGVEVGDAVEMDIVTGLIAKGA